MKTKVYDILNLDTPKKGIDILFKNNDLPHREIEIPDYVTPEIIREGIKISEKSFEREKPYYVEVENPIESGDFLDNSPFYRDNVGTEELNEDTR